ncbi:ABC transporter ATP-binding protein [uncultured Amnibacterium sp.]|uniref:ABC transporter ATP-binding protein n=1 Tax=uncultured Amnibacterium sp. TaxID=1631851 RepID=UPI0035CA95E1
MSGGLRLDAERIVLRRGGATVLDDVGVAVPAGSIAALTGPSGSGKTTLLTVLAALERPDGGSVRYDGRPVTPAARGPWVGRVQIAHQAFGLLSLLSSAENVELALQTLPPDRRPARSAVRTAAAEALAAVGLTARADHLVEELSGGEQQRVALARAMVTTPELLFADEPTAQLDAANRAVVVALLRSIADGGTTVVVATHDPDLTAACDLVIALADGRVRPRPSPATIG